jgi:ABC-2 type transport system ATP-binding protein
VSVTLREGDIYGLVGRNGAGKTTFFKCVMGLAKSTAGEIRAGVGGGRMRMDEARRHIGFMISPAFFPYLGPKQNLEYLRRVKGIKGDPGGGDIDGLLRLVGLDGVKKPFKSFSLGMKQRLGIAGALLGAPPIVVLDEPINGLDPQGIADIRAVILQANRENGTTFLISSHILSELDLVATRFGFIEQGCLLQEITHTELHEQTRRSLVVDVNDGGKAAAVLKQALGADCTVQGDRLVLETHIDQPNLVARALLAEGVELYQLAPKETTLEAYFMRLIGGVPNA